MPKGGWMRFKLDGDLLIVDPGEDLDAVPEKFREALTPFVRTVFANPARSFRQAARRCPLKQMGRWFRAIASEDRWELQLLQHSIYSRAGFCWKPKQVRGALVGLCDDPAQYRLFGDVSQELLGFYQVVQFLLWKGFYRSGGVSGPGTHMPVSCSEYNCDDTAVDPRCTYQMGHSSRGDVLIYTTDDRGGWLRPRTGKVILLGSVAEMLDWVFGELLAGREPKCPAR
jgi:hypothetical protein